MNDTPIPVLLTLNEVAERLGVGRRTINAWISQDRIRVTQIGPNTPRLTAADLADFIESARRDHHILDR